MPFLQNCIMVYWGCCWWRHWSLNLYCKWFLPVLSISLGNGEGRAEEDKGAEKRRKSSRWLNRNRGRWVQKIEKGYTLSLLWKPAVFDLHSPTCATHCAVQESNSFTCTTCRQWLLELHFSLLIYFLFFILFLNRFCLCICVWLLAVLLWKSAKSKWSKVSADWGVQTAHHCV